jgi:hypothetical protein
MTSRSVGADKPGACDLLIRNAYVVTANARRSKYPSGAIAISGRDIVAVGSESAVMPLFAHRRTIDAGGSLVHPGFIDMHYHATFHHQADTSKEDPGSWVAHQYTSLIIPWLRTRVCKCAPRLPRHGAQWRDVLHGPGHSVGPRCHRCGGGGAAHNLPISKARQSTARCM